MTNETLSGTLQPFMYHYMTRFVNVIALGYINQVLCLFGCVANAINMVVFYKLGLNKTINLSFFALAVSDFGLIVVLFPINCLVHLWLRVRELVFDPEQLPYLISLWPHVLFTRISILLTAYITFERCLCVKMPLTVNSIFTRRRLVMTISMFYAMAIASIVPIYYSSRYVFKYYPDINQTRLGIVFTEDKEEIETVLGPVTNLLFVVIPFIFIYVCTAVLVISLKRKSEWRQQTAMGDNNENVARREMRVCKMVLIVATMFIFCFTPSMITQVIVLVRPDLDIVPEKDSDFSVIYVAGAMGILMAVTNSAMNIFVYYRFSTRYRTMMNRMFRMGMKGW